MPSQCLSFAGVKGIQAGMEYYVCMVPLSLLSRLFVFSDAELPPEVRAQRLLNKARIPEMAAYILNNPSSYVFSALTASIDEQIAFEALGATSVPSLGYVHVPMTAKFLINDGQHRKAAIEAAIEKKPELRFEHIAVVLYADMGLKRSQQIFSDLNRHAIRPTKSIDILYDSRDDFSALICRMMEQAPFFREWVDKEHGTISNRSKALFTLSGLYHATQNLLQGIELYSNQETLDLILSFWTSVYEYMPCWQNVVEGRERSSSLRQNSISGHTILLLALGLLGNYLYKKVRPWDAMRFLLDVPWEKRNPLWSGKIVLNDRISASRACTQYLSEKLIQLCEEV